MQVVVVPGKNLLESTAPTLTHHPTPLNSKSITLMKPALANSILCIIAIVLEQSSLATVSFEPPLSLQKVATFDDSRMLAVGGDGLIVGGRVLTNNWVQRTEFQGLRFPLTVDGNGRIVCMGSDTNHFLKRVNPDGSTDSTFVSPALAASSFPELRVLAAQADGKILVGTSALIYQGLLRLNEDGSIDQSYAGNAGTVSGTQQGTISLTVLPGGKLLHHNRNRVRRLMNNGEVDPTFTIIFPGAGGIEAIALQPDGRIVIVGDFEAASGIPQPKMARFLASGEIDSSFQPSAYPVVGDPFRVKVQQDGKILTGSHSAVLRWEPDGRRDLNFVREFGNGDFNQLEIDDLDRIYMQNKTGTLWRYSGRYRIIVDPANYPQVLEKSSSIDGGWTSIMTVPANTSKDYVIPDFPGVGNTFYRTRPIQ